LKIVVIYYDTSGVHNRKLSLDLKIL